MRFFAHMIMDTIYSAIITFNENYLMKKHFSTDSHNIDLVYNTLKSSIVKITLWEMFEKYDFNIECTDLYKPRFEIKK